MIAKRPGFDAPRLCLAVGNIKISHGCASSEASLINEMSTYGKPEAFRTMRRQAAKTYSFGKDLAETLSYRSTIQNLLFTAYLLL